MVGCAEGTRATARCLRVALRPGDELPGAWLQDAEGTASNDPGVLVGDNPGTILPTGGMDHGYKGFSLALILETFTQGLSGLGRIDNPTNWGASVQVRVTDPECFCGVNEFRRQAAHLIDLCQTSTPRDAANPVRLPGHSALARKRQYVADGVPVAEGEEVYFRYTEQTTCGSEAFRNTYGFVPQGFAPCHPET